MTEQNAAFSMKVMVNLASPSMSRARRKFESISQISAEYWARRCMWLLVMVTSLWDIAVTFDRHFAFTSGLLSARLF